MTQPDKTANLKSLTRAKDADPDWPSGWHTLEGGIRVGRYIDPKFLQLEFDRLRDYLELMAVRMGPRLAYTLDLPPELAAQPVPTLLLQPLVENAIKHGLEPKIEGGHITVRARQDGAQLVLEVADTGVGAALDTTQALPSSPGFGLSQVRERLAAAYGTAGAINFVAAQQGGTRAEVRFPLQK